MWNFFWPKKQRKQEFRWTVLAPETRGQHETMALRENADDLGAAASLRQVIEASRPRSSRVLSSHTTPSLSVATNVSNVSADSEDFIRNPYADSGRRQRRQNGVSASSPLAVAPATQAADSVNDYVYVNNDKSKGKGVEQPQSFRGNLFTDPVGTVLQCDRGGDPCSWPFRTPGPIFFHTSATSSTYSHATPSGCQQSGGGEGQALYQSSCTVDAFILGAKC